MDFSKDNIKRKIKKLLKLIFNPRLLLCILLAWFITNGWCYVFVGCGVYFGIGWMAAVGAAYAGLLWLPFTPEKLLTVIIAIFLLRLLFPEDKNTLAVLREELDAAKNAARRFWSKRKSKKENKDKI